MNGLNLQNPAFVKLIYFSNFSVKEGVIEIKFMHYISPNQLFTFNKPYDDMQIWYRIGRNSDLYEQGEQYKEFRDIVIFYEQN